MERRAATLQHGCFVGLSGGVDSGCIALRLVEMKVAHHIFSLSASEEVHIVQARHAWASREAAGLAVPHPVEQLSHDSYAEQFAWFPQHVEAYAYTQPKRPIELINDAGAAGLSHICAQAKPLGVRVYLSGAGADEIHGNYGRVKQWPANLSEVWPWPAFFGHEMRDYLRKEEHVAGAHGIEGRFPYLDVDVVQEYLWLNTTLKATRQGAAARSKCRCSQQLDAATQRSGGRPACSGLPSRAERRDLAAQVPKGGCGSAVVLPRLVSFTASDHPIQARTRPSFRSTTTSRVPATRPSRRSAASGTRAGRHGTPTSPGTRSAQKRRGAKTRLEKRSYGGAKSERRARRELWARRPRRIFAAIGQRAQGVYTPDVR